MYLNVYFILGHSLCRFKEFFYFISKKTKASTSFNKNYMATLVKKIIFRLLFLCFVGIFEYIEIRIIIVLIIFFVPNVHKIN